MIRERLRGAFNGWLPVLVVLALASGPASAQADNASGAYSSEARPLASALIAISTAFDVDVVGPQSLVDGVTARAVSNAATVEQALDQTLSGTGLAASRSRSGGYVISVAQNRQTNTSSRSGELFTAVVEELVVTGFRRSQTNTATRLDTDLFRTPIAVNVITEEFIDTIVARRPEDVLLYTPGVGIATAQGGATQEFNIRGFSNGRGFFVNGYRGNNRFVVTDTANAERIDVLKGPAGIMFGTNPPGGLVNYVTKKPQAEQATSLEFQMGSFSGGADLVRGVFDSTGQIGDDDKFLYRLVLSSQDARQTQHGEEAVNFSVDDRILLAPSFRWNTPTGGVLDVQYEYYFQDQTFDPGIKFVDGQFLFNTEPFVGGESFYERDNQKLEVTYSQPLGENSKLTVGGVYYQTDRDVFLDTVIFGPTDGSLMPRFSRELVDDFDQFQPRIEFSTVWEPIEGMTHQILIGAEYFEQESKFSGPLAIIEDAIDPFNPVFGAVPPLSGGAPFIFGSEETGIYVQDYVQFGDKWSGIVGVRFGEFEETEFSEATAEDDTIDYNVSLSYAATDNVAPYVSFSTAKIPEDRRLVDGSFAEALESEQFEIGVKTQWADGRFVLNAAIFDIQEKNRTEVVAGLPGPNNRVPVGTVESTGIELEWSGQVLPGLEVFGGYAYVDSEVTESLTPENIGRRIASAPEQTMSLYAQYSFNRTDRNAVFDADGWSAGFGIIRVEGRFGNSSNSFMLPDFTRVDANVQYRRGNWCGRLTIENLADEDYVLGGRDEHFISQGPKRFVIASFGLDF